MDCGQEVETIQRNIKTLENKLFTAKCQVEHLQRHKYFRPFRPAVSSSKPETDRAPHVNHNSSGTSNTDLTLMKQLPPAGNLIVHDKGEKNSHYIIESVT